MMKLLLISSYAQVCIQWGMWGSGAPMISFLNIPANNSMIIELLNYLFVILIPLFRNNVYFTDCIQIK